MLISSAVMKLICNCILILVTVKGVSVVAEDDNPSDNETRNEL